jgi:hypothetical protein
MDDEKSLFGVNNDAITTLVSEWLPGSTTLELEDASLFPASGGFCTVHSRHESIPVAQRVTTFSYSGKDGDTLTGVMPTDNPDMPRQPGSTVVLDIMAQHRNAVVDAVLAIEKEIGHSGTGDKSSIEWFAEQLTSKVKIPRPWFIVKPSRTGFVFTSFRFEDRTYRLQAWQKISWFWDFGDGQTSTEQNPSHSYAVPGRYTVSLAVTNDYGNGTLTVNNAITVLGEAPQPCDVSVESPVAVTSETHVVMSTRPARMADTSNAVSTVKWKIEGADGELEGSTVRVLFKSAGRYRPLVTQVTSLGNFSVQQGPEVNVVDRDSAWAVVQQELSPSFTIEEYSPSVSTWKSGKVEHPFARDWAPLRDNAASVETPLYCGGLHEFIGTFSALFIANTDGENMKWAELSADTDTVRDTGIKLRGWGWTSARINTPAVEAIHSQQVWVMFGRVGNDEDHTDLVTVEHYGMTTRTWETMSPSVVAPGADDEDVLREAALTPGGKRGKRWRSANFGDAIFILGSRATGFMSMFLKFQPSTRTWKSLPDPSTQGFALDMPEATMASMSEGVYVIDIQRFMSAYDPYDGTWKTLVGSTAWAVDSSGQVTDKNTLLKTMYPSGSPGILGVKCYISGFRNDSFASYDESTRVATTLRFRRGGILGAGGLF